MLKGLIKDYVNAKYKRASLTQFVFLILIAIIALVFSYEIVLPESVANAGYFSSLNLPGRHKEAAAKQAILDWMGDNSAMPDHVLANIYNAAAKTGNRDLILAICLVESNFNPHAESDKGAIGLMGIMPGVWVKELKEQGIIREKEDLYKISGNIAAGSHVLATYLSETNDLRLALIRYVGGASWYATRVFRAQKNIEIAQCSNQQLAL